MTVSSYRGIHHYDNAPRSSRGQALAESIVGRFKSGVISRRGPWRHWQAVELATLHRVHRYGHRRLFGPLGHVSLAQFDAHYSHPLHESAMAA